MGRALDPKLFTLKAKNLDATWKPHLRRTSLIK